jgi:hypothetical protein
VHVNDTDEKNLIIQMAILSTTPADVFFSGVADTDKGHKVANISTSFQITFKITPVKPEVKEL